jgi:hypothetical protein
MEHIIKTKKIRIYIMTLNEKIQYANKLIDKYILEFGLLSAVTLPILAATNSGIFYDPIRELEDTVKKVCKSVKKDKEEYPYCILVTRKKIIDECFIAMKEEKKNCQKEKNERKINKCIKGFNDFEKKLIEYKQQNDQLIIQMARKDGLLRQKLRTRKPKTKKIDLRKIFKKFK